MRSSAAAVLALSVLAAACQPVAPTGSAAPSSVASGAPATTPVPVAIPSGTSAPSLAIPPREATCNTQVTADFVLAMTVNPGFGGQKFIASVLPKISEVRRRITAAVATTGKPIWLEVDGGVKVDNIAEVARAGADTFVAGSAIFGSKDYAATIRSMRQKLA